MTQRDMVLKADRLSSFATTLVLNEDDAAARDAYLEAADLYAGANDEDNARYMQECARACGSAGH